MIKFYLIIVTCVLMAGAARADVNPSAANTPRWFPMNKVKVDHSIPPGGRMPPPPIYSHLEAHGGALGTRKSPPQEPLPAQSSEALQSQHILAIFAPE